MTKDEFWEAINTGGKVYTYPLLECLSQIEC